MDLDVVDRCCAEHRTLEQLTRHLIREFAEIEPRAVAREVARALGAVRWIGLAEDELLVIELIARVQLELRFGGRDDIARLAPRASSRRGAARRTA